MSGDTTRARIETQRFHEAQALAEMGLKNERFIAILRAVVQGSRLIIFPVGLMLERGTLEPPPPPSGARLVAVVLYSLFCLATLNALFFGT